MGNAPAISTVRLPLANVQHAIDRIKSAQRKNAEMQAKHPEGSPEWHAHETVDDYLHDVLAHLGD